MSVFSYNGSVWVVGHNPDTGFIRDVGKGGWQVPAVEVTAGGYLQNDMFVVNGKEIIIELLLDDGDFDIRLGMVGETAGTRVTVLSPIPNPAAQALYASYWYLTEDYGGGAGAGVLSEAVNFPVLYTTQVFERLANSAEAFRFTVRTPKTMWPTPPIGSASGAYDMRKWYNQPQSVHAGSLTKIPNVDLYGGNLADEIPLGVVNGWYLIRTNVTPTPAAILRTMWGLGALARPATAASVTAKVQELQVALGVLCLDSFIERIQNLEYDSFTLANMLAYFEYYGAIPFGLESRAVGGGDLRSTAYPGWSAADISGGNIGWKQDREVPLALPPSSRSFPYEGVFELTPKVLKPGTGGAPTFSINNPVSIIQRRVGIHIAAPFAQDKIQILVRKMT